MILPLLLAIQLAADNSFEFFRLPDDCPIEVPSECLFAGNPTNEILRITSGSMSALYAAYTGQWERDKLMFDSDINYIAGPDPDDPEHGTIYRPLEFWLEKADLSTTHGYYGMGFGDYDLPTNRVISTRRLVGWKDIPAAIDHLRDSLTRDSMMDENKPMSICYSSLLPLKIDYDLVWSTNIFEILGVSSEQEIASQCWPQFGTLSNDWFVSQNNVLGPHARTALSFARDNIGFYGLNTFGELRSTNTFLSTISPFVPTNSIQQLTNTSSRLLYWRQAAYNLSVAAVDISYKTYELPRWSMNYYDDYAWCVHDTSSYLVTMLSGAAHYSNGKLELLVERQENREEYFTTNGTWTAYGDMETTLDYSDGAGQSSVYLSAGVNLLSSDLRNLPGIINGHTNIVVLSLEDDDQAGVHKYFIQVSVYDATDSRDVGNFKKAAPAEFEGIFKADFECWCNYKNYEDPVDGHYTYNEDQQWIYDRGWIESDDFSTIAAICIKTNGIIKQAQSCVAISASSITPNFKQSEIPFLCATAQSQLLSKENELIESEKAKHNLMATNVIDDVKKRFTLDLETGPIGQATVRRIGDRYEYLVTNSMTWAEFEVLRVGGLDPEWNSGVFATIPSLEVDGHMNGILTHHWKFPNLRIERRSE